MECRGAIFVYNDDQSIWMCSNNGGQAQVGHLNVHRTKLRLVCISKLETTLLAINYKTIGPCTTPTTQDPALPEEITITTSLDNCIAKLNHRLWYICSLMGTFHVLISTWKNIFINKIMISLT